MELSKELNEKFKSNVQLSVELTVKVISAMAVPFGNLERKFILPKEVWIGIKYNNWQEINWMFYPLVWERNHKLYRFLYQ